MIELAASVTYSLKPGFVTCSSDQTIENGLLSGLLKLAVRSRLAFCWTSAIYASKEGVSQDFKLSRTDAYFAQNFFRQSPTASESLVA